MAGPRCERKGPDQPLRRTEVSRRAYQALQTPRQIDEGLLLRMLKGIATRNYEACAETVPEAFGLSRSSQPHPNSGCGYIGGGRSNLVRLGR